MSFKPDDDNFEQKMLMFLESIDKQLKLLNLRFEEVHDTDLKENDIEEE